MGAIVTGPGLVVSGGAASAEDIVSAIEGDAGAAADLAEALGLAAPAVPTTGLVCHLRAGDLSGADGDPIGTWSNAGFDFGAAGSARPTLLGTARGINGRPALFFDGSDDLLSCTDADLDLSTITIVAVVQATYAIATSRWLITRLHDSTGGSPYSRVGIYHPASGVAVRVDGTEHTGSFVDVAGWDKPMIWCLSVGAAGTRLHVNGRLQKSEATTAVTYPSSAAWCIGGRGSDTPGEWWHGKVGDVLIYGAQLSAADRQKLEGALGRHYDIAVFAEDA